MLMNIDKELEKILKYFKDNIKIRPIEITDYCLGGKHLTFHTFCIIDNKMTKLEYSFYLKHYKNPSDNYANAEYLLHIDTSYSTGGTGYAIPYNSIEDFKNDKTVKDLIDTVNDDNDNEPIDGQISLFDVEEEQKIEEIQFDFDNLEEDPIEELLSYGIDEYYCKMLKTRGCMTFNAIKKELLKLPKYKEYMKKFGEYLKSQLPLMTYEMVGNDFNKKCLIETDTIGYRINGNRQQYTAYCLQQYMKTTEHKSLF